MSADFRLGMATDGFRGGSGGDTVIEYRDVTVRDSMVVEVQQEMTDVTIQPGSATADISAVSLTTIVNDEVETEGVEVGSTEIITT